MPAAKRIDTSYFTFMPSRTPENDKHDTNIKSGRAYGAAISLFAAVVGGLIVGWLLDRWLGTAPWLLVVGLVLGAAAGFYEFIRATSRLN